MEDKQVLANANETFAAKERNTPTLKKEEETKKINHKRR